MATDRAAEGDAFDAAAEALRREQMDDPAVRRRLREIFAAARAGKNEPVITAEELPDFLREHGR